MEQHHAAKAQIRSSMSCCAGSSPMPCDLAQATKLQIPEITIASASGHGTHSVGPSSGPFFYLIDRHDLIGQAFDHFEREKFPTPLLYLQNLSFLI